jgi:hypothetical protein
MGEIPWGFEFLYLYLNLKLTDWCERAASNMTTKGKKTAGYYAVARYNPYQRGETDLYGQFNDVEDAKDEQKIRGGKVVRVVSNIAWEPIEN